MYKRIVTIVFIIVIFVFGYGTAFKLKDKLVHPIVKNGFNRDAVSEIESEIESGFAKRYGWISFNGAILRSFGITYVKQEDGTDVYKLNNGDLMYTAARYDVGKKISAIKDLNEFLEAKNIKLLYVQLPFKIERDSSDNIEE